MNYKPYEEAWARSTWSQVASKKPGVILKPCLNFASQQSQFKRK